MVNTREGVQILTASRSRLTLKRAVRVMGLDPNPFEFHAFRRSGACLAFDQQVPIDKIKLHGHWHSEAIWAYLSCTPKSAASVASAFKNCF